MTINDEARRNLAIAIEAPITLGLMALNGAWHPFWLLSWLVNTTVILGSMVPVVLWKKSRLARVLFLACAGMCLAVIPLQLLADLVSADWLAGIIPFAIALEGCWWVMLVMPGDRPQAGPPPQVVHHVHVHHGLPGGAVPGFAWTAASEAFPVVTGTVERPSLGARTRRQALAAANRNAPAPRHRVLDRITRGLR